MSNVPGGVIGILADDGSLITSVGGVTLGPGIRDKTGTKAGWDDAAFAGSDATAVTAAVTGATVTVGKPEGWVDPDPEI